MSFELGPPPLPPIRLAPPSTSVAVVPIAGPRGPKGDPGDLDDLAAVQGMIDDSIEGHVQAAEPHPAYDDFADLRLIFENGLV